jgi:hypothetical protein
MNTGTEPQTGYDRPHLIFCLLTIHSPLLIPFFAASVVLVAPFTNLKVINLQKTLPFKQIVNAAILFFLLLLLLGWDLRHQVLRPLLTYCTAPDDR